MAMTKIDRKQEEMKKAPTQQIVNGKKNFTSDTSVPGIHIHPTAATAATTNTLPIKRKHLCRSVLRWGLHHGSVKMNLYATVVRRRLFEL